MEPILIRTGSIESMIHQLDQHYGCKQLIVKQGYKIETTFGCSTSTYELLNDAVNEFNDLCQQQRVVLSIDCDKEKLRDIIAQSIIVSLNASQIRPNEIDHWPGTYSIADRIIDKLKAELQG